MVTYAQAEGKKSFDWNKALQQAIKKEPSYKKWFKMECLSSSWVTCACGNQCSIIPRDEDGQPEDDILFKLGRTFIHSYEENIGCWP